jgi:hypothetical protein
MHIQYPVQLVATCTSHWSQGLTLDLAFDPSGIHHHELTYTTLSHVGEKKTCVYLHL